MNEERETAYLAVGLYVLIFVALFVGSLAIRQPNPKVTIPLTYTKQDSSR